MILPVEATEDLTDDEFVAVLVDSGAYTEDEATGVMNLIRHRDPEDKRPLV